MTTNVKTKKGTYLQPTCTSVEILVENYLLAFSAGTTPPKEGGDPTDGNGDTPNPFKNTPENIFGT